MPHLLALFDSLEPCWKDRTCLAMMAGVASGIVSGGRRWDVIRKVKRAKFRDRLAYVVSGVMIGSVVSFFLTIIGLRYGAGWEEIIVALVVIGALVVDWGSDSGIELLRRIFRLGLKKWTGIDLSDSENLPQSQGTNTTPKQPPSSGTA